MTITHGTTDSITAWIAIGGIFCKRYRSFATGECQAMLHVGAKPLLSATAGDADSIPVRRPPASSATFLPFVQQTFRSRPVTPVTSDASTHPHHEATAYPDSLFSYF